MPYLATSSRKDLDQNADEFFEPHVFSTEILLKTHIFHFSYCK